MRWSEGVDNWVVGKCRAEREATVKLVGIRWRIDLARRRQR